MSEQEEKKEIVVEDTTDKRFNLAKEIWEWVYTLAIAIVIAMLIKGFIFDIVRVDGSSMFPTLVDNDRLIVTKLGYKPQHGDIIILDSQYKNREDFFDKVAITKDKDELSTVEKFFAQYNMPKHLKKKYYVKRVIAMPGQTVDLINGNVYIDGEMIYEPYYDGITSSIDPTVEYPITVDDECVFVMGDNRTRSKDSRSSELGQIPYDAILGKSNVRIWPITEIGLTK